MAERYSSRLGKATQHQGLKLSCLDRAVARICDCSEAREVPVKGVEAELPDARFALTGISGILLPAFPDKSNVKAASQKRPACAYDDPYDGARCERAAGGSTRYMG